MNQPLVDSPFTKTELHDATEPYVKKASRMALAFPDGKILINFEDGTTYSVLTTLAKVLGAKVVTIQGTWTFTPDREGD